MQHSPLLATMALLASCATIMSSGPHLVPIDSVPPGATVSYQDANVGVTPCTVAMRSRCSQVTLRLPGYHDQVVEVGRGLNGLIFGNILFGGGIGLLVDATSGAATTISTAPCWVELTPSEEPKPGTWTRPRSVASANDDDQGWVPEGQASAPPTAVRRGGPTRAKPWMPPPPAQSEDDGWVRHGSGF